MRTIFFMCFFREKAKGHFKKKRGERKMLQQPLNSPATRRLCTFHQWMFHESPDFVRIQIRRPESQKSLMQGNCRHVRGASAFFFLRAAIFTWLFFAPLKTSDFMVLDTFVKSAERQMHSCVKREKKKEGNSVKERIIKYITRALSSSCF